MEDIDLFIGMIQETVTEKDALIGSTFLCLIGDVFARMRFGDRFFYDNKNQAGSFTEGRHENFLFQLEMTRNFFFQSN